MRAPFGGYVTSLERLKRARSTGAGPTKPSMIGVLPRDGEAKDVRWSRVRALHDAHVQTRTPEGNRVILYAPFGIRNFFPFFRQWMVAVNRDKAKAFVRKITLDLNSKNDTWKRRFLAVSHRGSRRVDTRYMTLANRYGLHGLQRCDEAFRCETARAISLGRVTQLLRPLDFTNGKLDTYFRRRRAQPLQECCFIPRTRMRRRAMAI